MRQGLPVITRALQNARNRAALGFAVKNALFHIAGNALSHNDRSVHYFYITFFFCETACLIHFTYAHTGMPLIEVHGKELFRSDLHTPGRDTRNEPLILHTPADVLQSMLVQKASFSPLVHTAR